MEHMCSRKMIIEVQDAQQIQHHVTSNEKGRETRGTTRSPHPW